MLMKVVFLLTSLLMSSYGHSAGTPSQACRTLTPAHGVSSQNSPPPFRVVVPLHVGQGQTITVTVENREPDNTFRGFIIQARAVETQAVVGRFLVTENMGLVACPDLPVGSVATHSNPSDKSSVTLRWVAPTNFSGLVVFHSTFVQQRVIFWTDVHSTAVFVQP